MSNLENWKKHISPNLRGHLDLVDRKFIGLTEGEKETRKNILLQKQIYDNFILSKQKKKDLIRDLMEQGKEIMNSKKMSNEEKSKKLRTLHKSLLKTGATKVAMEYLLHSIQYRETYLGKQDPVILNMYCQYYTLLDNINHQRINSYSHHPNTRIPKHHI